CNEQYDIDDIILCEYGTTVVGLEMLRAVNEESAEESRKVAVVKSAVSTLLSQRWKPSPIFSTN
ncbi:GTP-sensing transcriptional pleiotropic repressor CodY, partial [human gut metagenome]